MKYLNTERPPVPPCLADALSYYRPGIGWWCDIEDKVVFMDIDGNTHPDNDSLQVTEDELEIFYAEAEKEWVILKQQQELRTKFPPASRLLHMLWKDMDDDIIPGKDGSFYKTIQSVIAKYSEGKDTTLYPYD
jgi:hypothetical protein